MHTPRYGIYKEKSTSQDSFPCSSTVLAGANLRLFTSIINSNRDENWKLIVVAA